MRDFYLPALLDYVDSKVDILVATTPVPAGNRIMNNLPFIGIFVWTVNQPHIKEVYYYLQHVHIDNQDAMVDVENEAIAANVEQQ